jgi:hypothetical protein
MNRSRMTGLVAMLVAGAAMTPAAHGTSAPEGANVYFINLHDGIELTSPFRVLIGLENMGIAPANLDRFGQTGHHHLLVNVPLPEPNETIPEQTGPRKRYIHLGGGQTQTTVDLPTGEHELQLLLGDHEHVPHNPVVKSRRITVEVVAQSETVCKPLEQPDGGCAPGGG